MPRILSVKELTQAIKDVIEGEFPFVWVKGQVSDLSFATSGHIYFVLKDEEAILNVVWFKSAHFLSLNLSPKELENGTEVICAGRIVVYPPKGSYQLIAELVQRVGIGDLHIKFEALKKKLQEKGYFSLERKRKIPSSPSKVAVITALYGAAIRDFLYIASKRGWSSNIRIYPCLVQGEEAPYSIAKAIFLANQEKWAEVLVIIRGGGSLEDLWAFNTEIVADAIFNSEIPVLTGIGHEVDITIADLTADKRAVTPSHAAQILWPERTVLMQQLDEMERLIIKLWWNFYSKKVKELAEEERIFKFLSPMERLNRNYNELKRLVSRLERDIKAHITKKEALFKQFSLFFFNLYPYRTWQKYEDTIFLLEHGLIRDIKSFLSEKQRFLEIAEKKIETLNPFKPLDRGYSLVYVEKTGELLRSKAQVRAGDRIKIRTKQDEIDAKID